MVTGSVTWKEWNGAQIVSRTVKAEKAALQETLQECVFLAKPMTPVRTGRARASIAAKGVVVIGSKAVGEWGSYGVPYFMFLNNGTVYIVAYRILERAASIAYPKLAARIKGHMHD